MNCRNIKYRWFADKRDLNLATRLLSNQIMLLVNLFRNKHVFFNLCERFYWKSVGHFARKHLICSYVLFFFIQKPPKKREEVTIQQETTHKSFITLENGHRMKIHARLNLK